MWFLMTVLVFLLVWFGKDLFQSYFQGAKDNLTIAQLEEAEENAKLVLEANKKLQELKKQNGGKLVSASSVLKEFRGS